MSKAKTKTKKVRINVITREGIKEVYVIAKVDVHPAITDRIFVLQRQSECFEYAGDVLIEKSYCKGYVITEVKTGLSVGSFDLSQNKSIEQTRARVSNYIDQKGVNGFYNLLTEKNTINNNDTIDKCKNLKHYKLKTEKKNKENKPILAIDPKLGIDGRGLPVEILSEPKKRKYRWKDRNGCENSCTINEQVKIRILNHKAFKGLADADAGAKIKYSKNILSGTTMFIDKKHIDYFPISKTKAIA